MRAFAYSFAVALAVLVLAMLSVAALFGEQAGGACGPGLGVDGSELEAGLPEVAHEFVPLYVAAARRYELGPSGPPILASIHGVETDWSRNVAVSSAGAVGHMQFMPATWSAYGVDANGDGRADPYDVEDAVHSAANYLSASGAPGDWQAAIFAYNRAQWYVDKVLANAERYGDLTTEELLACEPSGAGLDGGGDLIWPVRGPITSPFGMRWGRLHAGIDIGVPTGTPIRASEGGRVELAQWSAGYGNYVCINHTAELSTCYAHLSAYRVERGDPVRRGQVIGLVGCTGTCFGDHLHFEVRLGAAWSEPVDPMPYLGEQRS